MASACSERSSDNDYMSLECAICMDKFVDPCVLPCSHTFCRQCVIRHYECACQSAAAKAVDEKVVSCPACRQTWPLPDDTLVDHPRQSTEWVGMTESIPRPSCGNLATAMVNSFVFNLTVCFVCMIQNINILASDLLIIIPGFVQKIHLV